MMGRDELATHEFRQHGRDYRFSCDGWEDIEVARKEGWEAISSWGLDGWDLAIWPYVVISFRNVGDGLPRRAYQMRTTCEGDTTVYGFATTEDRDAAIDYLFLWYAVGHRLEEILANEGLTYDRDALDAASLTVEERFRGPFSWKRLEASESEVTA